MIRIILHDGNTLELPEKLEIPISMTNPIFDSESIDRVFSYSFRVGLTPKNRIIFGHANRMDNSFYFQDDNTLLEIDGFPFERGILIANNFANDTVQVTFKNPMLTLIEDLKNIKINKILDTVNISAYVNYRYKLLPMNSSYSITIDNKVYSSSLTNAYDALQELLPSINNDYPSIASSYPEGDTYILELDHLGNTQSFLVNEEKPVGMFLQYKLLDNETVQQDVIDHVKDIIENGSDSHYFPGIKWYDFYNGNNPEYKNWVNTYYDTDILQNTTGAEANGWSGVFVPFVRLKHIFDKAFEAVGIDAYYGVLPSLPDWSQLLVFNNYALDQIDNDINEHKNHYLLNSHVPDMTAYEVVTTIMNGFAQYMVRNGNAIELRFKKYQLLGTPVNWTGKSTIEYSKTPLEPSGFQLKLRRDEKDKAPPDHEVQLNPFIYGDGSRELDLGFGSLFDYIKEPDPDEIRNGVAFRSCRTRSIGSSDEKEIGFNPYPFKLFFERGLRNDSAGGVYNMSTNSVYDSQDNLIGNFGLHPNGEYGLFEYFFKGYIEYIQSPTVIKKLRLHIGDISTIKRWVNALRKINTSEGEMTGIVKSIKFTARMNKEISDTEVEFVRYATS